MGNPSATWTMPAAESDDVVRHMYLYHGKQVAVGGHMLAVNRAAEVAADRPLLLENCSKNRVAELLVLQGVPIDEPVVQHGPFVMTSQREIRECFRAYQETGFGGWPW